jgi:hypothetical protein
MGTEAAPCDFGGVVPAPVVYTAIQGDFADATRIVYFAMAGIMAASFLVAVRRMERGIPVEVTEAVEAPPSFDT